MSDTDTKNQLGESHPFNGQKPVPAYLVPAPAGEDGNDGLMFWSVAAHHKLLIFVAVIISTVIATVVAFSLTPTYRAEVLLSPVTEDKSKDGLRGLAGQLGGIVSLTGAFKEGDNIKDEAIATLKSRVFTLQFIEDEKLLPTLFDEYWDSDNSKWKVYPGKSPPTQWDAYELFDEKVRRVTESKQTGLVTVAVEWKDRELAASWVNTLVNRINSHMRRRVIKEAEKSVEYLNQELNKTTVVELQKAIYALIEEQVRRIMMANVREEYSFKVIDPAVVPDADEFEKPKRGMIIGLGFVCGLFLGVSLAFLRQLYSAAHRRANAAIDS